MLAKAASAEPMAKVRVMVRLTLMPMRDAAFLSSDTARIALPSLVLLMKKLSTTMISAVISRVRTEMPSTVTPPIVKLESSMRLG